MRADSEHIGSIQTLPSSPEHRVRAIYHLAHNSAQSVETYTGRNILPLESHSIFDGKDQSTLVRNRVVRPSPFVVFKNRATPPRHISGVPEPAEQRQEEERSRRASFCFRIRYRWGLFRISRIRIAAARRPIDATGRYG